MKKAGGIIAIIAGIFSVLAAIVTSAIGGIAVAVEADSANNVGSVIFGGILSSFLVIIFGSVCISAKSKIPGILLIISSIIGIIYGGLLVAIFMALSLVGGILTMFGKSKVNCKALE